MGDVNGDAFVDLLDVVLLQKYLIRKKDGSGNQCAAGGLPAG